MPVLITIVYECMLYVSEYSDFDGWSKYFILSTYTSQDFNVYYYYILTIYFLSFCINLYFIEFYRIKFDYKLSLENYHEDDFIHTLVRVYIKIFYFFKNLICTIKKKSR